MTQRADRRGWMLVLGALLIVGLLGAAVALWTAGTGREADNVAGFARAPVGCDTTLDFESTGTFLVYVETTGEFGPLAGACDAPQQYDRDPRRRPRRRTRVARPGRRHRRPRRGDRTQLRHRRLRRIVDRPGADRGRRRPCPHRCPDRRRRVRSSGRAPAGSGCGAASVGRGRRSNRGSRARRAAAGAG